MIQRFIRYGKRQSMYKMLSRRLMQNSSFGQFETEQVQGGDVQITDQCLEKIKNNLIPKGKFLRLAVKGGEGCDGFTYEFEQGTEVQQDDHVIEDNGNKLIVVDKESLILLNGCVVDYEETMAREGFVIQENPNADHTCSCKMSFSPVEQAFGSAF